jgi:hypothetical protein
MPKIESKIPRHDASNNRTPPSKQLTGAPSTRLVRRNRAPLQQPRPLGIRSLTSHGSWLAPRTHVRSRSCMTILDAGRVGLVSRQGASLTVERRTALREAAGLAAGSLDDLGKRKEACGGPLGGRERRGLVEYLVAKAVCICNRVWFYKYSCSFRGYSIKPPDGHPRDDHTLHFKHLRLKFTFQTQHPIK